jgi:hypothetical protein
MSSKKTPISKGLSYLALALPFLFGAPIVLSIGFSALRKDGVYFILILGILLVIIAMVITALAVKLITKSLFDNDK